MRRPRCTWPFPAPSVRPIPFVLALFLVAAPGAAQQPDSVRADSVADPVDLAPLVVTASRIPVQADRLGFATTVIRPASIDARRPQYAVDILEQVPGGFIDEAVGPGGPTIVRLRGGEEVFTRILVDGVAINENGGFADLQGLMLTNIDRVEVARG
ncbi:MAG: TonB-dependent receptor plug domain-containing protein, partial [Gemmatimonadetes bacterium]|nr:TonB-dependent receptor [Gemmatimonadota bacterium]NIQ53979.1 TonB-dependent receptor [Gemmatimonadota bacterium]NIU74164.1 TonB-dependent receptor plug domain-containing protein [Gammaproteobacteria bacterium]NIX20197.1 TonB-dependent receptor plug domain-containing protein [Actinomycetota bacterium]NIX44198.1 TonB-dependent receptor plug domain-containing protein [Gemmatimonadota bacterium]